MIHILETTFPYLVTIADRYATMEADNWCIAQYGLAGSLRSIGGSNWQLHPDNAKWTCNGTAFCFREAADAILFKLRFG